MATVSYVTTEQAGPEVQATYEKVRQQMGNVLHMFEALAHNPMLMQTFIALDGAAGKTHLDGRLRDLAYLKVSSLNGCCYCQHYHTLFGKKGGLTQQQIDQVSSTEDSDVYDNLQRDVLRYAEQVTCTIRPEPALVERLKQRLSDPELMDLTFTIGLANLTNRFNEALGIELP